ncbi:hypothetical protein VP01_888g2 [Puccinia sorghi]|uniref:Uncharacterized protein n=1 Tax=Puccinia sorghi TaxID=27349 RepID=A0A0L6U852_9BASI|nr:hypothetical protein VP01_888g2 [Puccinia sorghi]
MPNLHEPNRLMKRQSNQTASNAAAGDQSHSPPREGAESHRNLHNSTEHHASRTESPWTKNQTDKNDGQQLQSSDTAATHNLTSDAKEESSRDNTGGASSQTATQSPSSGSSTDGTASNLSSSSLSLNRTLTPETLTSASGKYLTGSHGSNETLERSYSLSNNKTTNATLPAYTLPSELSSPTNASSPVDIKSSTAEQQSQNDYHSKAKAVGISFGCLGAVLIISTAIFLIRKRLKAARSRSNDSNRAVRDRSSLEPVELGGADPFACPSSFSKKPLILRPQSASLLRNSFPHRPSILPLRNQTIKSQISPPVIEPRHPLYGPTPENTNAGSSSKNRTSMSSSSWYQHRPGVSKTRDPYNHLGTVLSVKNPDMGAGVNNYEDNKIDTTLHSTPVPPRPPRPEWPILPFDSTGIKSYSRPVEEAGAAELPAILPLNVSRRPYRDRSNTFAGARHQSIDQIILESPESGQDSPTLPQYRPEQEIRSICSINDREPNPARASQLSRSTCYSQSSEDGVSPAAAHHSIPDRKTPTELKFVSFGPTRSTSSQLEHKSIQRAERVMSL